MPTDIYLIPCSFLFTVGILSLVWPEIIREFAWINHGRRKVRVLAKGLILLGLSCWCAREYGTHSAVNAGFSILIFIAGSIALAAPSAGLQALQFCILAENWMIRVFGVAMITVSGILVISAVPTPHHHSMELLAQVIRSSHSCG
ncbi:MAG TPA: hypothetical protein PLZ55_00230 [bacterium]|nr:hypothetical protein [bacterium]HPO07064.1 hypothetical protein [bacterium]HQO36526.1 hypothetical protein [bacterium]HQP98482.1 hypothetical protein [bacterium]